MLRPPYETSRRAPVLGILGAFRGQTAPPPVSSTALVQTNLTMKSGEKTVVGVSKMDGGGKGLILIISGEVIG